MSDINAVDNLFLFIKQNYSDLNDRELIRNQAEVKKKPDPAVEAPKIKIDYVKAYSEIIRIYAKNNPVISRKLLGISEACLYNRLKKIRKQLKLKTNNQLKQWAIKHWEELGGD